MAALVLALLVDELTAAGLVEPRRASTDRRIKPVGAAASGCRVSGEAGDRAVAGMKDRLEVLTAEEEHVVLTSLLKRVVAGDRHPRRPPTCEADHGTV